MATARHQRLDVRHQRLELLNDGACDRCLQRPAQAHDHLCREFAMLRCGTVLAHLGGELLPVLWRPIIRRVRRSE